MVSKRRVCVLLVLALVFVTGGIMLGGCKSTDVASKVVKIAVPAPLSGFQAADGEEMVRGAKLAAEEINAAGGVAGYTLEIVAFDVKYEVPDTVVGAVEQIKADKDIHAALTAYCSTTNFEIRNMAEINMPYMVGGNVNQTVEIIGSDPDAFPTVWQANCSYKAYETDLPRVVEEWASQGKFELRNKTVAIITSDYPYSKTISDGLKQEFPKRGWTITLDEMVPYEEINDWRTILAKISSNPPDLVVNTETIISNEAVFVRQFLENPTPSLLFIQYGPSTPEFVELTKDQSSGILYNLIGGMIDSPKLDLAMQFKQKFTDKYGVEPSTSAAQCYTMVNIYAEALRKVGDPARHLEIGNAIGETDMMTVQGHMRFDSNTHLALQGDDLIPCLFYEIWEGKRNLVWPLQYATDEFRVPPWFQE